MTDDLKTATSVAWPEFIRKIRARTPARVFVARGAAYSTSTQLDLRSAHARAIDAVWSEFHLESDFPPDFVARWRLFEISTNAPSKSRFLLRPDLGRSLSDAARLQLTEQGSRSPDVQIVIGDGLSPAAVAAQVPGLLPLLHEQLHARGFSLGQPFVVRYCRVGIMNAIGDLLAPRLIILLIGERPGLATAESLSAYMAYAPKSGQTDADRNLISNIHARGFPIAEAAVRITDLASQILALQRSGTSVKEGSPKLLL
ncbi:MAG TPA: ethanolamine ammonia-lyase subunit EutC [Candidatus Eisenbacteria bacterium]|nr:ethanolamine ammonia-lyase subunit EutC [Candidatus Eisenbacteria bacterium]